jgi:hypothetical protein
MISRMHGISTKLLACIILGVACLAARGQDVSVTKEPVAIDRKTFDPAKPPKDMPPLHPGEAAVTQSVFGVATQLTYQPVRQPTNGGRATAAITIQKITIKVNLQVNIFLPARVPADLRTHEETHRRISETFYVDAAEKARKVAETYVGRTFTGEGKDAAAAEKAIAERVMNEISSGYMQDVRVPATRVNALFDEITDHGRKRIVADEAMKQAMETWVKESGKSGEGRTSNDE